MFYHKLVRKVLFYLVVLQIFATMMLAGATAFRLTGDISLDYSTVGITTIVSICILIFACPVLLINTPFACIIAMELLFMAHCACLFVVFTPIIDIVISAPKEIVTITTIIISIIVDAIASVLVFTLFFERQYTLQEEQGLVRRDESDQSAVINITSSLESVPLHDNNNTSEATDVDTY